MDNAGTAGVHGASSASRASEGRGDAEIGAGGAPPPGPMLVRFGAGHAVHHQAIDFLKAAAAGDARSAELARALALAVGEALEPVNRLVAAVLAGGPFTIRRALELAEVVMALAAAPAASPRPTPKAGEGK